MPERNVAFVDAFLALHLTGAVLFLLIILSTVLLPGGKRHPIFFSFCLSWIVFGLSYSFLLLCGQQFKRPTRIVCTIQAALIYSSPLLEIFASLGLVIHLFLNILSALSISPRKDSHRTFLRVILTLPWIVWIGIFVGVLSFGLIHENKVVISPNFTYCVVEESAIPKMTAVATTLGVTGIFAIQLMIGLLLYRNRAIVNIFGQSMGMAVRVLIFTMIGLGALSCGVVFTVTRTRRVEFDLIISLSALTFGTQSDLLLCWMRCRPPIQPFPVETLATLTTVDIIASPGRASFNSGTPSRRQSMSRPPSPRSAARNESVSFLYF